MEANDALICCTVYLEQCFAYVICILYIPCWNIIWVGYASKKCNKMTCHDLVRSGSRCAYKCSSFATNDFLYKRMVDFGGSRMRRWARAGLKLGHPLCIYIYLYSYNLFTKITCNYICCFNIPIFLCEFEFHMEANERCMHLFFSYVRY